MFELTPQAKAALLPLAHILLGGLFVAGGIRHFTILPALTEVLRGRGVPLPRLALVVASLFQAACGALLVLGSYVTEASIGLIAFTLAASVVMLNFWDMKGEMRETARNMWLSNLAIIGGLLLAAVGTTA